MRVFKGLLLIVALPICIGFIVRTEMLSQPHATSASPQKSVGAVRTEFEVATIKLQDPRTLRMAGGNCHGVDTIYPANAFIPPLGRCLITFSLTSLLSVAYSVTAPPEGVSKITGGPAWVDSDFWLVEGKAENVSTVTQAELKQMLQTLLADRFKLQFHHETKELAGYAMVVANSGLNISEDHSEKTDGPTFSAGPGGVTFRKGTLSALPNTLSGYVDGPVIDKTGLTGLYSFTFRLPSRSDPDAPSIFTAVQEQLGLRLVATKVPADIIVIDHAERPKPD